MSDANAQELGFLARLVIVLAIVLIVAGLLWHGVTVETFQRFWHDLIDRPDGPIRPAAVDGCYRCYPRWPRRRAVRPCPISHDGGAQSAGTHWTAAGRIERER
jgi:hypothetical protein